MHKVRLVKHSVINKLILVLSAAAGLQGLYRQA